MLKNHWNTLKLCLFGQTTKQWLSNFEGWGLNPVAYKKICTAQTITIHKTAIGTVGQCNSTIQNTLISIKKSKSNHFLFLMK